MFYEFFQKILRTLFAFNFYVFSKLTFDIDVINDKRIVLLKQINSWNEEKFQSSILFKIIQSIICKFSKIDTWQRMNRYKNYFQFTQKFKIKKSPNQRILFSRGWTSRTDNILISWIRSFHRSWIQINTLFGIIQCKTTVTRIFLFSFFFFSSQEIVHRRMFWLKLYARSLITIRPAIRTFYSPDPCVKPAAKTNYTNPIEDYSYPIDSDFLARGFEIVFGWKRVENIWS